MALSLDMPMREFIALVCTSDVPAKKPEWLDQVTAVLKDCEVSCSAVLQGSTSTILSCRWTLWLTWSTLVRRHCLGAPLAEKPQ